MDHTSRASTVAAYLVDRLASLGAEHVFAVPGDYVAAFLDAVDASSRLRLVAAANEQEAGYAADGYARYRPIAALAVTYGVGAMSALNAVAGSYVERLPVVVINGSPSHANRRIGRERGVLFHHSTGDVEANLAIYRPVTVAAEVLASGVEAPEQIDRALRTAITHHRPVYIECLKDVWNAPCRPPAGRVEAEPPASDPSSLADAVDTAWALLAQARRGVVWAGIELRRQRLEGLLLELLSASGWPFMTTLLAKSLLAEDHGLFAGVYAGPASLAPTREAMEGADAILALGTLVTDDYLDLVALAYEQMIVAFDGQVRVGSRLFPDVALEDFAFGVLRRFLDARPPRPPAPTLAAKIRPRNSLTFQSLFAVLEQFLDPGMVLIVDESDSMYVSASTRIRTRGGYASQAAWGSIGYAQAGAIGVGFATGRRPVVVIGDGGFQMTCQALSTLEREQLGAIVLIIDNGLYGIEQALVDLRPFDDASIPFKPYNILPHWDYAKLAQAMGGLGLEATSVRGLRIALQTAKTRTRELSVIRVAIAKTDLPEPIQRLATDTGYPRHPSPEISAALRLASLKGRNNR